MPHQSRSRSHGVLHLGATRPVQRSNSTRRHTGASCRLHTGRRPAVPKTRGARCMASGDGRSVMVVEDDPSMRQALGRLLRLAGYAALAYESAEAFIGDGNAALATCLVLDLQLPGITGFELRERLVRDGFKAPVIFITAYDEPESRDRAQ